MRTYKFANLKLSVIRVYIIILISAIITACGGVGDSSGSGSSTSSSNSATNLTIITPNILPSTSSLSTGYVVVQNNTSSTISGISYTIVNAFGSASGVTLVSNSCSTIPANSQCVLNLNIPSSNLTGSFSISASNANSTSGGSQGSTAISVTPSLYSSASGPNGITLYFNNTVVAGTKYILVTGIVNSPNAGNFNTVLLADSSGNALANQTIISGNMGAGATNLAYGSTFAILLVPPSAGGSEAVYVQTEIQTLGSSSITKSGTVPIVKAVTNLQTATVPSAILSTTTASTIAIVAAAPTSIYLAASSLSQVVTITNTGNATASRLSLTSNNSNVSVNLGVSSLAPGVSTTATVSLLGTTGASTTSSLTMSYNDAAGDTPEQSINVYQNTVIPVGPTAGLAAMFGNNLFSKTTNGNSVSQQLVLNNTGNTSEANIVIGGLPSGFSLTAGSINPCSVSGNNISNILTTSGSTESCSVTVTYSSSTATSQTAGTLSISYTYNNGIIAPYPATAGFTYQTIQSTASLSLSPLSANFGNILSNSSDESSYVFTLINNGDNTATNISTSNAITGANASLFSINNASVANACGASLASGESCQIGLVFGPASSGNGSVSANLAVSYLPYAGASASSTQGATLEGILVNPVGANISVSQSSTSSFAGGSGTSGSPFQVQQSTSAAVSYTVSNTGTTATNFYIVESGLPTGWTLGSNSCGTSGSTIILSSSCSFTVNFNSATTGSNNLNLSAITANWNDEVYPITLTSQALSGTTYVNVFMPASITVTTMGLGTNESIVLGSSFSVIAALSGGYDVALQQIELGSLTPTSSAITYTNNPCSISSSNSSCTITVNVGSTATVESYTLSASTSGSVTISSGSIINFSLVYANPIFAWVGGSNLGNQSGTYGSKGSSGSSNIPGARFGAVSWTDSLGNMWLFSGEGYANSANGYLNDLWKYSQDQWTWVSGASSVNSTGVYGAKGVESSANNPGARTEAASWIDATGDLWIFGGYGYTTNSSSRNVLNDLWKYDIINGEWVWISGSESLAQSGVYGTKGTASANNVPGARLAAMSWSDGNGNLWLFGGSVPGSSALYNDLWKYNISSGEWTWMSGSNTTNQPGTYGTQGISSVSNTPGARASANTWADGQGNLWLFGGSGIATSSEDALNDLWKYNISSGEWTWVSGSNSIDELGIYGIRGVPSSSNIIGARYAAVSWQDSLGNFWIFGGASSQEGNSVSLNDLWQYNPSTGLWTWIAGSTTINQFGEYGTLGTGSIDNIPGARYDSVGFTESGNFWLFGGTGYAAHGAESSLNDLWKINIGN